MVVKVQDALAGIYYTILTDLIVRHATNNDSPQTSTVRYHSVLQGKVAEFDRASASLQASLLTLSAPQLTEAGSLRVRKVLSLVSPLPTDWRVAIGNVDEAYKWLVLGWRVNSVSPDHVKASYAASVAWLAEHDREEQSVDLRLLYDRVEFYYMFGTGTFVEHIDEALFGVGSEASDGSD